MSDVIVNLCWNPGKNQNTFQYFFHSQLSVPLTEKRKKKEFSTHSPYYYSYHGKYVSYRHFNHRSKQAGFLHEPSLMAESSVALG